MTEVIPAYQYANGQRTDTITGYKYTIALPERGLEKVNVRIDGPKLMEAPESSFVEVKFDGLELYFYWQNNLPQVGAKATGIALASNKG